MTKHSSATAREPHANQTTRTATVINALKRRAQAVLNDTSIDARSRAIIRYGLETNDPWLAELVRRADEGENIIGEIDFSQTPESNAEDSNALRTHLFKKISNHTLKGVYHMQVAMAVRNLATLENQGSDFHRVLQEYEEADRHFKAAHNKVCRAHVKNNVSYVLRELGFCKEAREYLDHARRLTVSAKDKVKTAQVDESRAQLFIAEGKFDDAEAAARNAAKTFEKSGHQCFLAEALTTLGIALARLGKTERAQFTIQEAIEIAHQAGSMNRAGLAALTMIEEIGDLPADILSSAYEQAGEWLANIQSNALLIRFKAAGNKLAAKLRTEAKTSATETLLTRRSFKQSILDFERAIIRKVLAETNGSVTHAAPLLGMTYPGLIYIIQSRHPDLLKERTPVRRRPRK